jgi:hypothetical protein
MLCESKLIIPQSGNLVAEVKGEIFEIRGRFCKNAFWIPREAVNGAAGLRVV